MVHSVYLWMRFSSEQRSVAQMSHSLFAAKVDVNVFRSTTGGIERKWKKMARVNDQKGFCRNLFSCVWIGSTQSRFKCVSGLQGFGDGQVKIDPKEFSKELNSNFSQGNVCEVMTLNSRKWIWNDGFSKCKIAFVSYEGSDAASFWALCFTAAIQIGNLDRDVLNSTSSLFVQSCFASEHSFQFFFPMDVKLQFNGTCSRRISFPLHQTHLWTQCKVYPLKTKQIETSSRKKRHLWQTASQWCKQWEIFHGVLSCAVLVNCYRQQSRLDDMSGIWEVLSWDGRQVLLIHPTAECLRWGLLFCSAGVVTNGKM